ncbi:hypothetical protein HK13_10590 [Acetobacter indonesiensis]|nr:hypothetical protein HK13_10590 [Acetobacter indonesiensis]
MARHGCSVMLWAALPFRLCVIRHPYATGHVPNMRSFQGNKKALPLNTAGLCIRCLFYQAG